MRALLAIALLPACLIAPDPPIGMVQPGTAITVDGMGCLPPATALDTGTVGALPDGRDALYRSGTIAGHLRVYEMGTLADPTCYTRSFPVDLGPGAQIAAMDVTVVGGQQLFAIMAESLGTLAFSEIEIEGTNGSVTSTIATPLSLPPILITSDSGGYTPRWFHRMSATDDLWFGGTGNKIGVIHETSLGVIDLLTQPPVLYGVMPADGEAWLEAAQVVAPKGLNTAVLVGESEVCLVHELSGAIGCDPADASGKLGCTPGDCPGRALHVAPHGMSFVVYSGFTAETSLDFHLEIITADGTNVETTLAQPMSPNLAYSEDVVLVAQDGSNSVDALTLWYDLGPGDPATLVPYGVDSTHSTDAPGNRVPLGGNGAAFAELQIGRFASGGLQLLVVGDTAKDLRCLSADGTFAACAR